MASSAANLLSILPKVGRRMLYQYAPPHRHKNGCSHCCKKNYLDMTDEELIKDCEMGTFKASGPGGQHRNKRESAVRLKHVPTGIVAQAVEDRSQHKNRASALSRLRTLLALKGKVLLLYDLALIELL